MQASFGKILIVDDDEDVLHALRLLLKKHAHTVHTEKSPEMLPTLLKNEPYDIILLDMNFTQDVTSGREGFFWIDKILGIDPSAIVILMTAYGDVATAVQAIKAGATDFVLKPWQNERLLATIAGSVKLKMTQEEASRLRSGQMLLSADLDNKFQDFVGGRAPAMNRVFDTIQKVAQTDANVLILGENGTGKELVARELHRQSSRSDEVFVTVDMGAIAETLFESELFGHTKGSFTGAHDNRAGRFEVASKGTLFLDEIGNLSLPLQAKLLTVLQRREIIRVGANKSRPIDVRVICATNMPIYDMVKTNSFRQDLLYRVNTVEIKLPALTERVEDIPDLVDHFVKVYANKYNKNVHGVRPATLKKLEKYRWPGNVRELQHMIERAIIMTDSNILQPDDFLFAGNLNGDGDELGLVFDSYNLEEVERLVIRRALSKEDGNISKAAEELGLTRASLYRRLEKYGL